MVMKCRWTQLRACWIWRMPVAPKLLSSARSANWPSSFSSGVRERKIPDEAIRMIHRSMRNRSPISDALKAKPDCLTPVQLEKFAEDSSLKDPHLAECSRCQTELALLKSFQSSEPLPDEGAAVAWISARLERNLGQIKGLRPSREAAASQVAGSSGFSIGRRGRRHRGPAKSSVGRTPIARRRGKLPYRLSLAGDRGGWP